MQAYSQDHVFKVLASKSCMIKQGNNWVPIVRGASLQKQSEIKLAEGGYAALLHITGKTLEVKNAGVFKTDDLASKISTKSLGFSQKYATFAMNQIGSSSSTQQSMNVTGAVTRGGGTASSSPIKVMAPQEIKALKDIPLYIEWIADQPVEGYMVEITDASNKVVASQEVNSNSGQIDLKNLPAGEMNVKVVKKNDPTVSSATHKLSVIDEATSKAMHAEIDEVVNAIDQQSAAENFIVGSVYEEKGLLLDALKYYKKSAVLGGDVADYKDALNAFTLKNGIPSSAK